MKDTFCTFREAVFLGVFAGTFCGVTVFLIWVTIVGIAGLYPVGGGQ